MTAPIMKPCPFCAEEIHIEAKKCKHCGEFLTQEHAPNHKPIKPGPLDSVLGTAPVVFCPNCRHTGKAKLTIGGNLAIELVLWLTFVIPGLLYHLWRNSTTRYSCTACGFQGVREAEEKPDEEGRMFHRLTHRERSRIVQPAIVGLVVSYFLLYREFMLALPLVILLIAGTVVTYKLRIGEKQKHLIVGSALGAYALFVVVMLLRP